MREAAVSEGFHHLRTLIAVLLGKVLQLISDKHNHIGTVYKAITLIRPNFPRSKLYIRNPVLEGLFVLETNSEEKNYLENYLEM